MLTVPLDGEVGDTPGAALMKSNMLNRRVGMALRYSGPKRVSNPLLRASMREPEPSTTTDSATPASFRTTVRSMRRARADADVLLVIRRESLQLDVERVRSRGQGREPQLPSLVRGHRRRPANQRRRGDTDQGPARTPPCSSLTVPMRRRSNPARQRSPAIRRGRRQRALVTIAAFEALTMLGSSLPSDTILSDPAVQPVMNTGVRCGGFIVELITVLAGKSFPKHAWRFSVLSAPHASLNGATGPAQTCAS